MSIIDRMTVTLNLRTDSYEAWFSNLGLGKVPISENYPQEYDRLLCGGIWCIINLEYLSGDSLFDNETNKAVPPIVINKLTPIQMPYVDMNDLREGRKAFTKEEWIDVLLRSIGMEPDTLTERENGFYSPE